MKYFILFILLSSCAKIYEIKTKNGIKYFEQVSTEITELRHVEWSIGKKKDKTVSRGIRLATSVPIISSDAKNILRKKYGVDSWVYRFSRTYKNVSNPLGYVYYHFDNISKSTKSFTTNLYYHASTVSERFRSFVCPAFGHRLLLEDVDLAPRRGTGPENIFVRSMRKIPSQVKRLEFKPQIFSTGVTMKGTYSVEFALYNSKTKQRFSSWSKVNHVVPIKKEVKVSVPSCIGVKEENKPLPESRRFDLKDLEIK